MMRDSYNNHSVKVAVAAAALNATPTAPEIDIGDAQSVDIHIAVGVGGITFTTNNKVEFVLTHSDTSGSNYVAVTAADVIGPATVTNGIVKSLVSEHAAADVTKIGYIGGKRYLKLTPTFGGSHASPTPMSANVVTRELRSYPAA